MSEFISSEVLLVLKGAGTTVLIAGLLLLLYEDVIERLINKRPKFIFKKSKNDSI